MRTIAPVRRLLLLLCLFPAAALAAAPSEELAGLDGLMGGGSMLEEASPDSLAQALLPNLSRALGLAPKRAVVVQTASRAQLKALLLATMRRQYPGARLERMSRAYQAIGLLAPKTDLRAAALKLYEAQVAGFYDPSSGRLALMEGTSPTQQAQLMQHELTHALQDQHFGLQKLIDAAIQDDDRALALQAVIEGQAVVAMFAGLASVEGPAGGDDLKAVQTALRMGGMEISEAELKELAGGGAAAAGHPQSGLSELMAMQQPPAGAPAYLQAQLMFPYQEGTHFVEHLLSRQSLAQVVHRTLRHPPTSTAEVLHPERYGTQPPVAVSLAPFLRGRTPVYDSTVGELNVRTLLGGVGEGDVVASGWRGDRLAALADGTVGWLSVWASPAAASEFVKALAAVLATQARPAPILRRHSDRVFVLDGAPADQRESLLVF